MSDQISDKSKKMKTKITSEHSKTKYSFEEKRVPMIRKMFQMLKSLVGSIYYRLKGIGSFHNNTLVSIKQSAIKSKNIQQEVLVFTQTSFVQKVLIENIGNINKSDRAEELEKACWNGMLYKMLPELMPLKQRRRSETSIWQIYTSECSLLIDIAEAQNIVQNSRSISPFLFLSSAKMN